MDEESPDQSDPTIVFVEGDATVVPLRRKRPDYTHRPKGAGLWALLVPFLLAEVVSLRLDVEWTLSRTVWWVLGPEGEPRWWLIGLPLWGLLLWTGPHFLWPHLWGGRELTGIVLVMLAAALVGITVGWMQH